MKKKRKKIDKNLVVTEKNTTFALAFENIKHGWLPEWPNGADCKSAGYAFGGSNPSPPTFIQQTLKSSSFLELDFLFISQVGKFIGKLKE